MGDVARYAGVHVVTGDTKVVNRGHGDGVFINTSGIAIDECRLPVNPAAQSAYEILGMDPIYVANVGKLGAIVPNDVAEAVLARMKGHPWGAMDCVTEYRRDKG